MLVSEKLSTLKSEKVKALGYKQDRKTVCNHFYQAYPMETVFDDTQLTGLYFAQIAEDRYNNGFFGVFNYIGDGIYVDTYFTGCYGNDSVDRLDNGKLENDRLDKRLLVQGLTAEHRENWRILIKAPLPLSRKFLAIMFAVNYRMTELMIHIMKSIRGLSKVEQEATEVICDHIEAQME